MDFRTLVDVIVLTCEYVLCAQASLLLQVTLNEEMANFIQDVHVILLKTHSQVSE